jgi:heptosyltransferase-2
LIDQPSIDPHTIVVFCPNWVGDAVMATPAFECLRSGFPRARIAGVIRPYARGVVADSPWFDLLIDGRDKTPDGFRRLVGQLRRLRPELAVLMPNSIRSALLARLGGARRIFGYRRGGRSLLLSGGPAPRIDAAGIRPIPMIDYYLELCRWMGLEANGSARPRLFISDAGRRQADTLLRRFGVASDDMLIGINPGAKFGASKCWPPEHFARLAELLSARWACKIVLFVGPGEQDISRRIIAGCRVPVIDTAGQGVDLSLLKPLIDRCQLLVTNDTGPRHYAVSFGVPVVVIMGPTDPRYTEANLDQSVVLRREMDCSPCHLKTCPENHACMVDITPEAVLAGCEQALEKSAAA